MVDSGPATAADTWPNPGSGRPPGGPAAKQNVDTWPKGGGVGGDGSASLLPGSHRGSSEHGGGGGGSNLGDSYEELLSQSDEQSHSDHEMHFPPFVRRRFIAPAGSAVDETSVVAAAGSNGVVAAWTAASLLSSPSPAAGGSGVPRGDGGVGGIFARGGNKGGGARGVPSAATPASAASIGQPEAAFLAHSRAVNRLAWHPTGRRPYLLLTASQDGTVKLWDRRASSPSPASAALAGVGPSPSGAPGATGRSWFGLGRAPALQAQQSASGPAAAVRTAGWYCVQSYQPKCDAVRDIKWNPVVDDRELHYWVCLPPAFSPLRNRFRPACSRLS